MRELIRIAIQRRRDWDFIFPSSKRERGDGDVVEKLVQEFFGWIDCANWVELDSGRGFSTKRLASIDGDVVVEATGVKCCTL